MRILTLVAGLATLTQVQGFATQPANQVFQFSVSGTNASWPDGTQTRGTLHLWIPEDCERVRGLLVLGANVPEHSLVGDPLIRDVCKRRALALVWSVPSFWSFTALAKTRSDLQVAFLERLLAELAEKSGYSEIATAPWIPIGESGHLLMVAGLVDERPARTLAAICVKNPHYPINRTVPMLWTLGTGQEWRQKEQHPATAWRRTADAQKWATDRASAGWPLSVVVEPGTGHFACSQLLVRYFVSYIEAACEIRLPGGASTALRDVPEGVLGAIRFPRDENLEPSGGVFWYWNADLAQRAAAFSEVDWSRTAPLAGFRALNGAEVLPYSLNSVTRILAPTDRPFRLEAFHHSTVPEGFKGQGEQLAGASEAPSLAWICGPLRTLGDGWFEYLPDRTALAGAPCYLLAEHPGNDTLAPSVQPARIEFLANREGSSQTIDFELPERVSVQRDQLELTARATSGLPVRFHVESGPAVIDGNLLKFTKLPPRSRLPVAVEVVASQPGSSIEVRYQAAPHVRRTVLLTDDD